MKNIAHLLNILTPLQNKGFALEVYYCLANKSKPRRELVMIVSLEKGVCPPETSPG